MASSPSHKLGQLIGNFLELGFKKQIDPVCEERNLFLDVVGTTRPARGRGKKVSWKDVYDNKHDLDFVLERNGTKDAFGKPAAVIECAWRRYTKHSKNKAQEIQGAVMPIAERYSNYKPFLGAVIAGEYTAPSIDQLESCGFGVLYFEYQTVVNAFAEFGVDVSTEETTPVAEIKDKVKAFEALTEEQLLGVYALIAESNKEKIKLFMGKLTESLDRQIDSIVVTPLYGKSHKFSSIGDVSAFIKDFDQDSVEDEIEFNQLFIRVVYGNKDEVTGEFKSKKRALGFLNAITFSE